MVLLSSLFTMTHPLVGMLDKSYVSVHHWLVVLIELTHQFGVASTSHAELHGTFSATEERIVNAG
jgi:hypothetical protein